MTGTLQNEIRIRMFIPLSQRPSFRGGGGPFSFLTQFKGETIVSFNIALFPGWER
jgi:hypothetical protein